MTDRKTTAARNDKAANDLMHVLGTFKIVREEEIEGRDFYDDVEEACQRCGVARTAEIDRECWAARLNTDGGGDKPGPAPLKLGGAMREIPLREEDREIYERADADYDSRVAEEDGDAECDCYRCTGRPEDGDPEPPTLHGWIHHNADCPELECWERACDAMFYIHPNDDGTFHLRVRLIEDGTGIDDGNDHWARVEGSFDTVLAAAKAGSQIPAALSAERGRRELEKNFTDNNS